MRRYRRRLFSPWIVGFCVLNCASSEQTARAPAERPDAQVSDGGLDEIDSGVGPYPDWAVEVVDPSARLFSEVSVVQNPDGLSLFYAASQSFLKEQFLAEGEWTERALGRDQAYPHVQANWRGEMVAVVHGPSGYLPFFNLALQKQGQWASTKRISVSPYTILNATVVFPSPSEWAIVAVASDEASRFSVEDWPFYLLSIDSRGKVTVLDELDSATQGVASTVSSHQSSDGTFHVAYLAPPPNWRELVPEFRETLPPLDLKYVSFEGGEYSAPVVISSEPRTFGNPSIVSDASGDVDVVVGGAGGYERVELWHFGLRRGRWRQEAVPIPSGRGVLGERDGLARDDRGELHFVFCDYGVAPKTSCTAVGYATNAGGKWSVSRAATERCLHYGSFPALEVADDRLHVGYVGCDGNLMYASKSLCGKEGGVDAGNCADRR